MCSGNKAVSSDAEVPTQTSPEGSAWESTRFHFAQTKRELWSTLPSNTGCKTTILFSLRNYRRAIDLQTHSFQGDSSHFGSAMGLLGTGNVEADKPIRWWFTLDFLLYALYG